MMKWVAAALAVSTLASVSIATPANAAVGMSAGEAARFELPAQVETVQFAFGGRSYCFYGNGWRGPGWYRCGYAQRRGYGWGGGVGWNGWGSGHRGGGAMSGHRRNGGGMHMNGTGGRPNGMQMGGHMGGVGRPGAGHGGGHGGGGHKP